MPDSMIKRVEYWAKKDNQSRRQNLEFRNRNNERFDWDDDEEEPLIDDNAPEPDPPTAQFPHIPAEFPGIQLERDLPTTGVAPDPEPAEEELARRALTNANVVGPNIIPGDNAGNDRSGTIQRINIQDLHDIFHNANVQQIPDDEDQVPDLVPRGDGEDSSDDEEDDEDYECSEEEDVELEHTRSEDEESEEPESTGRRASTRTMRPPKRFEDFQMLQARRDFRQEDEIESEMIGTLGDIDEPIELMRGKEAIFHCIMLQCSLKQGLKKWGKRAEEGAMKEMQQLHDLESFFPRDVRTLTREGAVITDIPEGDKDSGEIKGRTCINGAPQRDYIRKEDAASPTACMDSVFITGAINAHEGRDVATMDLPGAFLNTVTDEMVIMVLKDELCEMMCRVKLELYWRYVTCDKKGKPMLYVQLYKALYGLMRPALLFYRKLRNEEGARGLQIRSEPV